MRALTRSLAALCLILVAAPLAADPPIPPRRLAYTEGMDLAGRDRAQLFDTTLAACERACLQDPGCEALTFNARNNSCFPKSDVTGSAPYQGAFSGVVLRTDPAVMTRAEARRGDLGFVKTWLDDAYTQALTLGRSHLATSTDPAALLAEARRQEADGNPTRARALTGAALVLRDAPELWLDYARLSLAIPDKDQRNKNAGAAIAAAINGYLRAPQDALRAEAARMLSEALIARGRGKDAIPALELAHRLSPRDDIAAALEKAIARFGFRIVEHQVEADSASPRICAIFSGDLARGTDYAPYVTLPQGGLSVEAEGNQICVGGLSHGARYALTFRTGLPAAKGPALHRDVTITAYVRDRSPAVRFPGRAYILPRAAQGGQDGGLPIETVNTETVAVKILRISDRNLVAAMRADYFARSLNYWEGADLAENMTEEVWHGTADVAMQINRDMTTNLPVQEVTGPLGPGIYVLQASLPGADPYDTPPASQWFAVSDLGLTTLAGTDGLHVVVRGLSDAGARAGAEVVLVSRANAVLGRAVTDAEGHARFAPGLLNGKAGAAPALVSVAMGDDMSFLSLEEPAFDLSDRGVEGAPPAPPIDVFLATDRGAYRPGEVIHTTLLARDGAGRALDGLPLTLRLMRPDGVEHSRALADAVGAGGHVLDLFPGAEAARGTWRIDVLADPEGAPLLSRRVLVEDFLPERIDFTLDVAEGPFVAQLPPITLAARYLFGAPGADLAVSGEYRLSAADDVPGFAGYRWGPHDAPFQTVMDTLEPVSTDAGGQATLTPELGRYMRDALTLPATLRYTVQVAEGSGRPVERSVTRSLLPGRTALGIRPLFEDDTVPEGTAARFELAALGADGSAAARKVSWRVNRVETDYQWYTMDGRWYWDPFIRRSRVAEGVVDTAPGAPAQLSVPVDWGRYELIVTEEGGDEARASMEFGAGWYAADAGSDTPDRLEVGLDKAAYRAGETAHLRVRARTAGVGLVSVLGNRVVALRAVDLTAGENTIDLPVTAEWGAGAYVTVSALSPETGDQGPARAMGLVHAPVDPGDLALAATLEVAAEAEPRSTLPVALRLEGVQPGETAYATIAAVDLGILNLTGFQSPDPQGHYFGQRRLGVELRDIYGRLIDGRAGSAGALRSGGDGDNGLKSQARPPTEELVAYFSGPLVVGSDGLARTSFDIPAFNGTVRVMAVAWSPSGVGQASADVVIADPVVMQANLPRFMAPGDMVQATLEFTHARGPAGRMGLDIRAENVTLGPLPSGFDLATGGRLVQDISLVAPPHEGLAQLRVALSTPDGRVLTRDLSIPVRANDPPVAQTRRLELAAGQTLALDRALFADYSPGSAQVMMTLGPLARFDAAGLLARLDSYPYGCTEQTTSKALPLLYLSQVARAMRLDAGADLDTRITAAIARVLSNQDSSGAFGLWSSNGAGGDLWLDAYVTDFLSRARAEGHAVPQIAFRNALDNLRTQVSYAPDFDASDRAQGASMAYALMVLAREGAAAMSDLRYYADVKGDDFATPLAAAQIGAALAAYGDQMRADAMFTRAAQLLQKPADDTLWRVDYGSSLRDRAAVVTLALEAGSTAIPPETAGAALADRMAGQRLSTQEATWTLMAAHALLDRPGAETVTLDGAPLAVPVARIDDDGAAHPVTNTGAQPVTLTLTTIGVPAVPETASGNGYAISRSYFRPDGTPVDPAQVARGDRLVVVLTIQPQRRESARLMVSDPLPAGFEIDNPHLIDSGSTGGLDWLSAMSDPEMAEFRDDRFLAAVNSSNGNSFRLAYRLRAVTAGDFHHPAASVEDMYRPDFRAVTDTGRVRVR
ncbi:alpha-2-macroglobulin family protein [Phaeovulum vinaykumarii]|uniref:Apple domain-containing protein n=1 Tax=Phaeovulum vinaykumarii TaxID=407234 RepID=A0A1N7KZF5_9RHOB|nr:alpha-2-macroglobulin family protein [Phaeovulum vinaykumarii]SIS66790.1 hypothetical protein SAMN05421795_102329 [Phaeovulum vinaykumarii]SOC00967.1 hypothetical protein SAMN05878426_102443 [Phaeovulum vinaykumarii]